MAAKILYFGRDTCYRLPVLVRAGYAVESCTSLEELRAAFLSGPAPHAILVADENPRSAELAVAWLRSRPSPPLVLFCDAYRFHPEPVFDLVIPALTSPALWLSDIAEVIARRYRPAHCIKSRPATLRLQPDAVALRWESPQPKNEASENSETDPAAAPPFLPPALRSPIR
jgi:hypothetical protein